jgi:hypothetical protein
MAFKRFLNPTAFNRANQLKEHFANWQSTPGSIVHLRPGNTVAFYFMGQKALELGRLGATDEYTKAFQQDPVKGVNPAALQEQLKDARRAVINDVKNHKKAELVPAKQAALAWELLRRNKDFTLLDEQVQLPQDALADKAHETTRPDLLLLEHATGRLCLAMLKLSDDADLDGAVIDQLKAARALPAAMKGGEALFLQHYQQLFEQKAALGLIAAGPSPLKGIGDKSLIILGDAAAAYGRLACVAAAHIPPAAACALLPAGAQLKAETFLPLTQHAALALAGPRAAYAPRKPRANAFTRQADAEQAAWANVKPAENQAGAFDKLLAGYSKKNGLSLHLLAKHPRNSQAACAQALAPVFAKNASGVAGFITAVNAAAGWGVTVDAITDCHFEVPHALTPGAPPVFPQANLQPLTGETGRKQSGLSAALAVTGTKEGRPVRALIGVEFKYTEAEFSACSGFTAPGFRETSRAACLSGAGRGELCFLRLHEKLLAFTKFNLDAMFTTPNPVDAPAGACGLLGSANQLYRGHFATMKLKERLGFEEALFLVVYDSRNLSLTSPDRPSPEHHPALGPLEAYKAALADQYKGTFAHLPVQQIVAAYCATITKKNPPWLVKIRARYHW